jgi:hypothetical protein
MGTEAAAASIRVPGLVLHVEVSAAAREADRGQVVAGRPSPAEHRAASPLGEKPSLKRGGSPQRRLYTPGDPIAIVMASRIAPDFADECWRW